MKDEEIRKHARALAKFHYQKILDDTSLLVQLCVGWNHPNLEETVRTVLKEIQRLKE